MTGAGVEPRTRGSSSGIVNDSYGHLAGDKVIAEAVSVMKAALFERDILCRYGGEEFVVLFTATSREGAIRAIEKVRALVESHGFYPDDGEATVAITVNIGFASCDERSDVYELLELADTRLYKAKQSGKNRVCCG
jgi:diguanylate cyclase (GGDEF)-like protein